MLKHIAKRAAAVIAPNLVNQWDEARWLAEEARAFRDRCLGASSLDEAVELAINARLFRAAQNRGEILGLLEMLTHLQPRTLCEIGAAGGGTLCLFAKVAQPDAGLLSLDIAYPRPRRWAYGQLRKPKQNVFCLSGDSHSSRTKSRVCRWLGKRPLDFLFIDGDHSFKGVAADFEMYGPLVRPGGMIAFHDIVPDSKTRHGKPTAADVGEVPRFWELLKQRWTEAVELVDDYDQDGKGIGVLRVDQAVMDFAAPQSSKNS